MPAYETSRYDPPAPVAHVGLREINGSALVGDVFLLIDTGADVTLLPRAAVIRMGFSPVEGSSYELIGFDGTRSTTAAVDLNDLS
jgi:hypothetical protein